MAIHFFEISWYRYNIIWWQCRHWIIRYWLALGVLICLDRVSIETLDLDTFKKLVLTIEIFRSTNLDFVSTPPSSPKSLDRDQKICPDMTFLANLDSLSWSRSRVSHLITFHDRDFSICPDVWFWSTSKSLDKSWKVLTNLKNLDSLDLSRQSRQKSRCSQVSIEKSQPRKKKLISTAEKISTLRTFSILIGLDCRDPQG